MIACDDSSVKDKTMTKLPSWNLQDLFDSPEDPKLAESLTRTTASACAFAQRYQGTIASLSPQALAEALTDFEQLQQEAGKPLTYASLLFAADTAPANGAFVQKIREQTTAALLPTLFFSIELSHLDGKRLAELAQEPALKNWQRYLTSTAQNARYLLSEPEEKLLAQRANTGYRAWTRLFQELLSSARFSFEGEEKTLSEIAHLQQTPDRCLRQRSAEALTTGLQHHVRTLAYIYNTLIQEKAVDDQQRGYEDSEQARHLGNELTPQIVAAVIDTAQAGYPLVGRFYRTKQKLLGLDSLYHYDRYAPLSQSEADVPFEAAKDLILTAFAGFDARYAAAGRAFFDGNWIDAAPRPGKQGGAFCSYVTPDLHPFLFQTYLGKAGDMATLAHELGHGIHAFLSRGQSYFNFHGTLPMAEVASTFAELLVFDEEKKTTQGIARRDLYARTIENTFSTIHRQTAFYRFEQAVHAERKTGELSVERFGELWQEKIGAMFDGAVILGEGHSLWWSYIPHFIGSPFYV